MSFDLLMDVSTNPHHAKREQETAARIREKKIQAALLAKAKTDSGIPTVVCLCGSTRFYKEFMKANYELTGQGKIVLSVGFYMHAANEVHGEGVGITPEMKVQLDELHKRKIDLADEVHVLNVGGYIGDSTRSEINYARQLGKPITYLEEGGAL